MKILVTGNRGFIGSHLCNLLLKHGYDGIDLVEGNDICNKLPDVPYTHVFHLAASKSVPKGEANPQEFIHNNCWGTANILRSYPNARIINVSSSSANNVRSVYGATKAFGETLGNLHKNCLNVRLYNVFGEGQPVLSGAVVPQFCMAKLSNKSVIVYGDGHQMRDFTYVGDVVHELYRLMFSTMETGTYHLGCANPIRVIELLELICGAGYPVEWRPKRDFEIEYSASTTPMNMTIGREEGLKRTIKWYEDEYTDTGI